MEPQITFEVEAIESVITIIILSIAITAISIIGGYFLVIIRQRT